MTINLSVQVRDASLDAIATAIGPTPTIKLWTGSEPSSTVATDSGTLLVTYVLGTTWASPASGGTKEMLASQVGGIATAAGTFGYYRIYDVSGTCHMQGTVGIDPTLYDMVVDKVSCENGQNVNLITWIITDGNP